MMQGTLMWLVKGHDGTVQVPDFFFETLLRLSGVLVQQVLFAVCTR